MKKLTILIIFLIGGLLCGPNVIGAQDHLRSSGLETSDAAVVAAKCLFYGVEIITDGTNAASIIVYDNASAASGTEVFKGTVAGANNFGGVTFEHPVEMFNGIFVDVSGTGAAYIVYWKNK